jgi:branched-subunit amino acid transport protein AzlD
MKYEFILGYYTIVLYQFLSEPLGVSFFASSSWIENLLCVNKETYLSVWFLTLKFMLLLIHSLNNK